MNTLRIYKFNNYYNRILKRFSKDKARLIYEIENANFNPNDNIITEHCFGHAGTPYNGTGDYLVVFNDFEEPVSSWFIVDNTRVKGGQWKMSLKRDVLSDYYDYYINQPAFVEKGYVPSSDDAIFNSENMSFNQILKSQTPLMDKSGCAWIVGYLARDLSKTDFKAVSIETSGETYSNISYYPYSQYINTSSTSIPSVKVFVADVDNIAIQFPGVNEYGSPETLTITTEGYSYTGGYSENLDTEFINKNEAGQYLSEAAYMNHTLEFVFNQLITNIPSYFLNNTTTVYGNWNLRNELKAQNNKVIIVNNIPYLVKYHEEVGSGGDNYFVNTINNSGRMGAYVQDMLLTARELWSSYNYGTPDNSSEWYNYVMNSPDDEQIVMEIDAFNAVGCYLTIEEVGVNSNTGFKFIDNNVRPELQDAPWDMFCIPYSDDLKIVNGSTTLLNKTSKEWAMRTATAIAAAYSSSTNATDLYDLQLLPYCPIQSAIVENGIVDVADLSISWIGAVSDPSNVSDASEYSTKYNLIMYPTQSSDTLDIDFSIPFSETDTKVQAQCDVWRLCSPNYSGIFEFNAAKTGGVKFFNVDFTYRPYNPYIHVNPNFGRLYGKDFNDARGLICGGSFNIPTTSDAWATYERTNKNYQVMFDRQIQYQELQNNVQLASDIINATVGAGSGAASGAMLGSFVPGLGTAAGAVIGGVASGVGGVADIAINSILRNKAIQYERDQFGYQLENIKALPNSLTNVGTFTGNSKYFPFVEYYTCDDKQKQALRDKIKYNGMTIMRIGKISDYINYRETTYVKAKLIRLDDANFDEDFHLLNTIANELNEGVFI